MLDCKKSDHGTNFIDDGNKSLDDGYKSLSGKKSLSGNKSIDAGKKSIHGKTCINDKKPDSGRKRREKKNPSMPGGISTSTFAHHFVFSKRSNRPLCNGGVMWG